MPTLIVTTHPEQSSLTAGIAQQLCNALRPGEAVVADLSAEGFDPRFGLADRARYLGDEHIPDDVAREQRRLETVNHLVLVFPAYWWSMPALLKGWIDRVFINGWAFSTGKDGTYRNLGELTVHLIAIAGDAAGTYKRHGYEQALRTQIEHGIVDYVGARRGSMSFVYQSEQDNAAARHALVKDTVQETVDAIQH